MAFNTDRSGHGNAETMFTHQRQSLLDESQKAAIPPAPFLEKTYMLVDDPRTNHIVSWGPDEASFVVWRPAEFARNLLPNYFKHCNFSSFVRQLNTYGFRKIMTDRWEFANERFIKDEKHLLSEIQRRKTSQTMFSHLLYQDQLVQSQFFDHGSNLIDHQNNTWINLEPPILPALLPSKPTTANTLTAMAEENSRLRKRNFMLLSELEHMKSLYNDIVYFIQNHVKTVVLNDKVQRTTPTVDPPVRRNVLDGSSFRGQYQADSRERDEAIKLFGAALNRKKRLHLENID